MKLSPFISPDLADWAQHQPVFFTGSAPTHAAHINVSPKGLTDSHFAVLGPNSCAYIDRTGSGCETLSHAYENGRLCLMFMSFGAAPRILRLFCRARVVEWDERGFEEAVRKVAKGKRSAFDGARAVIFCDIWEVQTSCGFGVPRVKKAIYAPDEKDSQSQSSMINILREGSPDESASDSESKIDELSVFEARPTLDSWAGGKAKDNKIFEYQRDNNTCSIDGLPGLRSARRSHGQTMWVKDVKAWARRVSAEGDAVATGFLMAVFLYLFLRVFGFVG